jgi:NTP pyrophosphatase (non-canonical NTP hydrolase)
METQKSISEWAIKTFGQPITTDIIFDRFMSEITELSERFSDCRDPEYLKDECADCLIILYQFCQESGFDLHDAVDQKMTINRNRKWKTKGDGVGQHI